MYTKSTLLTLISILFAAFARAQGADIGVDNFTGSATVNIPLYTVSAGSLSMPISMVYMSSGVKVKSMENSLGMGWSLNAGGQITRELRGLPDDQKTDDAGNARLGWLYNTKGTIINGLTFSNDNSTATCPDETGDVNTLNTNFSDLSDTEPDVFHVSAPGLSCTLIFDKDHNLKVMPYQDLKVSYTVDANFRIDHITITNNQGVIYDFSETERTNQKTVASTTPTYFKRYYNQFAGGVTYFRSWKLSSMLDPRDNQIFFLYDVAPVHKKVSTPLNLIPGGSSSSATQMNTVTDYEFKAPLWVSWGVEGVVPTTNRIYFIYSGNTTHPGGIVSDNNKLVMPTVLWGMGQKILFSYSSYANTGTTNKYNRPYLTGMQRSYGAGVDLMDNYTFGYNGVTQSGSTQTLAMPDSTSKEIDYWGYYNANGATNLTPKVYVNTSNTSLERYRNQLPGSAATSFPYVISGTDRTANASTVINGTLSSITYKNGGSTSILWEPNTYYDNTSGQVITGGGARVKQLTTYDGINTANNIVKNYSYLNPASGLTSGEPVMLPIYAFTTSYSGGGTDQVQWTNSTIRSEDDLSSGDNSIIYGNVKVSQTGAGFVAYQYSTPATNWDANASTDWAPTMVNVARVSCSAATFATNRTRTYPFPQEIDYSFERGLLLNTTAYNDAGTKVNDATYVYKRSFDNATPIYGLSFDDNTTVAKNYAKYGVFTGTSELLSSLVTKVYDVSAPSQFVTTTVNYKYDSANHKLPTSQQTTSSDGVINTVYTKYVKDYAAADVADTTNKALYGLQQRNINAPIEHYYQRKRNGTTTTTAADLVKYNFYNTSFFSTYLPSQTLVFTPATGVSDFQPSAITSNAFTNDSRYRITANYPIYGPDGSPATSNNNRRHSQSRIVDANTYATTAVIDNARLDEIAFSNFDYPLWQKPNFTGDTSRVANAHSGTYGKNLSGITLTRTISKQGQASNYIFSAWSNSSGTITLTLTNSSSQSFNYTLTFTGSKWSYVEIKVPVTSMSASFTAAVTGSVTGPVIVDDLWFYPEGATINSIGYNAVTLQKTSETDNTGHSVYYDYDKKGRLAHVYDQDKNMVQKKTYIDKDSYGQFPDVSIVNNPIISNYRHPISFSVGGDNADPTDLQYDWTFGDGTSVHSNKPDGSVTHTYTHAGNYTVSVTKTSPYYGTKTGTKVVQIQNFSSDYTTSIGITNLANNSGKIQSLQFSQGGVQKYFFTNTDIFNGVTVNQGIYDVKVVYTGGVYNSFTGLGFNSIYYGAPQNSPTTGCQSHPSGTDPIMFNSIDLNGIGSINFTVSTGVCTGVE